MRFDADGLFWQDAPVESTRGSRAPRPQPPIPDTGWKPPREFPNLSGAAVIALDTETYDPELTDRGPGWARHSGHLCGVSIAVEDAAWYFPMRHSIEPEDNLDPENVLAWLRDTLGNPKQPKIGANLYYDAGWLQEEGVIVRGELVDVQYAEALLEEQSHVNLEHLGQKYLGTGKDTDLLKKWIMDYYAPAKTAWRGDIHRCPPRLVGHYAEMDAVLPFQIIKQQYKRLAQENLVDVFRLECGLIPLLVAMRFRGARVDLDKATQIKEELDATAAGYREELKRLTGVEVNVNAAESIAQAFDNLGLAYPRTKATDNAPNGKPSFVKTFLEHLDHPVGDLIRGIREAEKMANTFIQSYILDAHVDGRVYGQFHSLRGDENGTRSGRLSSSTPNLQNIPTRTEMGKRIREVFIPDDGRFWERYDYSQIEYRLLAHHAVGPRSDDIRRRYCTDPETDYHEETRRMVHEIAHMLLDRKPVKNINFGLTYAMGKPKLVRSLGLTKEQGDELFEAYHHAVPFTKATLESCDEEAQRLGYITTLLGRRSRFDLWEPKEWRGRGERQRALPYEVAVREYGHVRRAMTHKALNRRLQGGAADVMKRAMARAWDDGVFHIIGVPMLTVHDELDLDNDGQHPDAWRELEHILEETTPLRVPVRADHESGPNWGKLGPVPRAA